jgi:hypothetical protein
MTNWTLAAVKTNNLSLEAYCQAEGCKNFAVLDLDQLIALAGPDYIRTGDHSENGLYKMRRQAEDCSGNDAAHGRALARPCRD